jgi:hypothetical protein
MQSAPPEHPDTSPTAPRAQWDCDEAKYSERDHDNMKPQDRFSYMDAERGNNFTAVSTRGARCSPIIYRISIYGLGFERLSLASSQRR